jgi:formate dehydrogenase subunit delta
VSSTIETLRRMANDIARNLEAMGHDKAVLATADHIDKYWDPRMKTAIFADNRTGLRPVASEAIDYLATGAHPESQTGATEFNTAQEVGHSDAG